ncbi:MAG TPA: aminotransferase class I/II-fold pyridoxal phosphate-dependent enzyme [Bacteroidia bacterium]|nr:aminotransferase class I/II-fold pyridoxal phosphate-dependent enzyme [Bacteroidia bacterium]
MIDFTSSLYLAMRHNSGELSGWNQLTMGVPAAIYESKQSERLSQHIATMQRLETGVAAPSTLHLYWDLFTFLRKLKIVVFADEKIYPVSKYGIERLIARQIPVYSFRHMDANHLYDLLIKTNLKFKTPVLLTDGFCPQCGKAAPIKDYSAIMKPYKGNIIIDDTQAFGIFGERVNEEVYGKGGGGILKWQNIMDNQVITIVSLAKAFGAPMAVISGNASFISSFKTESETSVYSSPVSIAHLNAAANAIRINQTSGDQLRNKLFKNVLLLRDDLYQSGIRLSGGIFPVQSITDLSPKQTYDLYKKLSAKKIKTALVKSHITQQPAISIVVRCDHTTEEILSLSDSIKQLYPFGKKQGEI